MRGSLSPNEGTMSPTEEARAREITKRWAKTVRRIEGWEFFNDEFSFALYVLLAHEIVEMDKATGAEEGS